MSDFRFSPEDLARIEAVLREVDVASHELLRPVEPAVEHADWTFLVGYIGERLRAALEIGILARTFCTVAVQRGYADDRGVDHFLRSKAWLHNFGVTQPGDEHFYSLSAACDHRLVRALDALIEIAQDRMFGTLDDEYERLLSTDQG
ncbi:MAG TPA: hypothetical protein VFS18_00635 [Actinomycetota bacterium]|nr:hypothetical protein [Actinomycetota bacterium]